MPRETRNMCPKKKTKSKKISKKIQYKKTMKQEILNNMKYPKLNIIT